MSSRYSKQDHGASATATVESEKRPWANGSLMADVQDACLCIGTDQSVMLSLARHADGHGICYPGRAKIARHAGTGERNVGKILKRLEGSGLIKRGARRPNGTVCIQINVHLIEQEARKYREQQRQTNAPVESSFGAGSVIPFRGGESADNNMMQSHSKRSSDKGATAPHWNHSSGPIGTTVPIPPDPQFRTTGPTVPSDWTPSSTKHTTEQNREQNNEHARCAPLVGFDEFWEVFPKCRNEVVSRDIFASAVVEGADPSLIVEAARAYAIEKKGVEIRYVSGSNIWLEKRKWREQKVPCKPQAPASKFNTSAEFFADRVKSGKFVASSAINANMAREMLGRGLLSEAQLRAVGVYV